MSRPGLQVMTYDGDGGYHTSNTHMNPLLTRCPCWPASTANQSGLLTLTSDRQTDARQHHRLMPRLGAGYNNNNNNR